MADCSVFQTIAVNWAGTFLGAVKKRMTSLLQLDVTLRANELLHDDDINKGECKRLTDYLRKVAKEGSK